MKIAIVGSRTYAHLDDVARYVNALPPGAMVISGGAQGVDTVAEHAARARGLSCQIIRPEWGALGKRAGFVRNMDIVAAFEMLVAFWDGTSHGTRHAIDAARRAGKVVIVYTEQERYR